MEHCAARQAAIKQPQWVGGSVEVGRMRERERERQAGRPTTPPFHIFTAEVDVDSFTKWLSHDL